MLISYIYAHFSLVIYTANFIVNVLYGNPTLLYIVMSICPVVVGHNVLSNRLVYSE